MTWRDRDALFNPIRSIICILGLALSAALVITGIIGVMWGIVEVVRMVLP